MEYIITNYYGCLLKNNVLLPLLMSHCSLFVCHVTTIKCTPINLYAPINPTNLYSNGYMKYGTTRE